MTLPRLRRWAAPSALVSMAAVIHLPLFAQGTSFSPSISNSIAESTSNSGFSATFNAEASNLTNPELHTDISDPTHAQLLGSALSPAAIPAVNGYVESAPLTGTLSDAQLAVRYGEGALGGHRGGAFTVTSSTTSFSSMNNALSFRGSVGTSAPELSLNGANRTGAAFGAQSSLFSGYAAATPSRDVDQLTLDPRLVSKQSTGGLGTSVSYTLATDPVLTGAISGQESAASRAGNLPSPASEASQFFASSPPLSPQYQYDDGQTPPNRVAQLPGSLLQGAPTYGTATNGFPDSTKGLAGLPPEDQVLVSPLERSYAASYLSFPSPSVASEPPQRLVPNLHAAPAALPRQSFAAYEHKAQEQRLRAGLSISQSSMLYQQDLRDFQRRNERHSSRSNALTQNGPQQEIIQRPIR